MTRSAACRPLRKTHLSPRLCRDDHLTPPEYLGDSRPDQGSIDLQQLLRELDEIGGGQGAMPVVYRGLKSIGHARPEALWRGRLHAELQAGA